MVKRTKDSTRYHLPVHGKGYAEGGYVDGVYGIRDASGKPATLSATQISKMKRDGSPFLLSNEEVLTAVNGK